MNRSDELLTFEQSADEAVSNQGESTHRKQWNVDFLPTSRKYKKRDEVGDDLNPTANHVVNVDVAH